MAIQEKQWRYRMEGNALVLAHTRAVPPMHRVDVNLSASGQPPTQFVVADFLATAVVGEDRITDNGDNRTLILSHGILPLRDQQAIEKSTDSGESAK